MIKHALILVVGRKGSGKSSITKLLADKMGLRIVKSYKEGNPACSDEEVEFVESLDNIQNIAAKTGDMCVTYDDLYRGDFLIATPAMAKELRNNIARKFHIVDFCIYADEKLRKKRSPLDADRFDIVNSNESTAYSDYEKNHEYDILIYNNWAVEKAVDVMESYARIVMQYRLADLQSGVDPDADYLNWLAEQNPVQEKEAQETEPQDIPTADEAEPDEEINPDNEESATEDNSATADAEDAEEPIEPEEPEKPEEPETTVQAEDDPVPDEPDVEDPAPDEPEMTVPAEITEEPVRPAEDVPEKEGPDSFSLDDDFPEEGPDDPVGKQQALPDDDPEEDPADSDDGFGMFSLDDEPEEEEEEDLPDEEEPDIPDPEEEDEDDDLFSLGDDDEEDDSEEPDDGTTEEEPAEESDPFQDGEDNQGMFDLGDDIPADPDNGEQDVETPDDVPEESAAAKAEDDGQESGIVDEEIPAAESPEEATGGTEESVEEPAEESTADAEEPSECIPEEPVFMAGMSGPGMDVIERIRAEYPAGTRIELLEMDDTQAPPVGTLGTVKGVDDFGSLLVAWDTGSSLSVVYGVDSVRKVEAAAEADEDDDDWFDGDDDYTPVLG